MQIAEHLHDGRHDALGWQRIYTDLVQPVLPASHQRTVHNTEASVVLFVCLGQCTCQRWIRSK